MSANPTGKPKEYRTLYLLHGFSGGCRDWLYGSRIFKLARDLNLAVVMPSGENSFYIDHEEAGAMYGTYVGKELVDCTRRMFPLSHKREDTWIGGLSMGGFGSMLVGCQFAQTFGGIISLSGGFIQEDVLAEEPPLYIRKHPMKFYESIFGDLSKLQGGRNDPLAMAQKALEAGCLPPIYMACGKQDEFYRNSVRMKENLIKAGADVTWAEADGEHEWTFWDQYIEKAIAWMLALEKR